MKRTILVDEDNKAIHIGMAISLVLYQEFANLGIKGFEITYGDIAKLGEILTPKKNYWHTEYAQATREVFIPAIVKQYPALKSLDLSGVTNDNFRYWLRKQVNKFDSKYLKLKKITKKKKAKV